MSLNLDEIRNRLKSLQTQTTKQDSMWKPSGRTAQIRILPYKYNRNNPFIELLFHYNMGPKSHLSPTTFGRPDPITEMSEKLRTTGSKEDYKLARILEPKMRTFVPILVRGEEDQGPKFWGFGKTVYQEILAIISDVDYGDITDPMNGRDITVEFKTAEECGKSYPETKIRVKPNKSVIVESHETLLKLIDSQRDITEIYKEPTYEQLNEVLSEWMNSTKDGKTSETTSDIASDDSDVVEAKPSPKKPVTKPVSAADAGDAFEKLFKQK